MSFPNFNGAGLTLIHNENNNISILMAKSNSDKSNKKNVWIFPGGRKNDNEVPHETAYREFIEEVFNVVVDKLIIDEIISIVKNDSSLYPIDTLIPNNSVIPSYTLMQSSEVITVFVNVLNKHRIISDVFPFGYNSLYDNQKKVNIYQFCAQRRYIYEQAAFEKNELVFITMIPLNNLIYSIYRTKKHKEVFHYHGENLKIHVPSIMNQIKNYVNKLNTKSDDDLCNILTRACNIIESTN
jgi:hypothetical protein